MSNVTIASMPGRSHYRGAPAIASAREMSLCDQGVHMPQRPPRRHIPLTSSASVLQGAAARFISRRGEFDRFKLQDVARRKLKTIDAAKAIEDLRVPPGNRLEKLSGDRKGQWSIRINDQWRACFRWESGDAHDVGITDYH